MSEDSSIEDIRLIRAKSLSIMIDASERSIWRWVDAGIIPPPVKIGKAVRWERATILKWLADGCPRVSK